MQKRLIVPSSKTHSPHICSMMRNHSLRCLQKAKAQFKKLLSTDGKLTYLVRKGTERLIGNSTYRLIDLSEWLELPSTALRIWLFGIPDDYRYESFTIKKKNGRGRREIDAPNRSLKVLQRNVYHKLLKPLNLHQSATGIRSIRTGIASNSKFRF
jgi:hypothetical protein